MTSPDPSNGENGKDDKIKNDKNKRESFEETEEKKWLLDQTKYNIQVATDTTALARDGKSEQIKNLLSSYDIFLKGILTGMGFIATFSFSVFSTNLWDIPLGTILLIDFTLGPLIYIYFLFFRIKIFKKFPKMITAYSTMLLVINSIKGAVINRSLHLNDVSIEQLNHINSYLTIATLSLFPLERACNEILSSSALEYYHKGIKNELRVHYFAIASAFNIYLEKKEELLKEKFIVDLDNSLHQIFNIFSGQEQVKPLLTIYNEFDKFLTMLLEKTENKQQSVDRYIIGRMLLFDNKQTDTIVDRLVNLGCISKGAGNEIAIPKDSK